MIWREKESNRFRN